MNPRNEDDDLLSALAGLPEADLDPKRARAVLEQSTRVFTRRNRFGVALALAGRLYCGLVEPVTAGFLSLAMLASSVMQAIRVLQHGIGLWR